VSFVEEEEEKRSYWRGREVEFYIDNQTNSIILARGTYNLLKGKEVNDFCPTIYPGNLKRITVKASGGLSSGQLHCYLVYELVLKGQERMPIMKNQRAYIAVETSSEASSKKLTVSVVVFMVKSSQFTGDSNDVDRLHKDLLQYHIIRNRRISRFNINGRLLEMFVELVDASPVCINIRLKSIRKYIKYGPVFHRINEFA
jgi:hypothetical protein